MLKKKILISAFLLVLLIAVIGGYLLIRSSEEKDGEFKNAKLVFKGIAGGQYERPCHDRIHWNSVR